VLTSLGIIASQQNQPQLAQSHFEKALILARSYNDTWFLGKTLVEWGTFNLAQDQRQLAQQAFTELFNISQQSEFSELLAEAKFGLAQTAQLNGDVAQAKMLGEQSQALFNQIGHYKRNNVHTWLDEVPFSFFQLGGKKLGDKKRPLN
jgi:tetratricopeptide (TPR) repeat protein